MPIICLEGPSAVGKSSTARWLAEKHGAVHIPEANLLFRRPENAPPFWYYQRQLERWQMATSHPPSRLVILDGDPFQPIWYNHLFPEVEATPYPTTLAFYAQQLAEGRLAWPDTYVILHAPVAALQARKLGDPNARRRNFEKHLALVDFLPRYFGHLESLSPNLVLHQSADSVADNAQAVLAAAQQPRPARNIDAAIFAQLASWISLQSPNP